MRLFIGALLNLIAVCVLTSLGAMAFLVLCKALLDLIMWLASAIVQHPNETMLIVGVIGGIAVVYSVATGFRDYSTWDARRAAEQENNESNEATQ